MVDQPAVLEDELLNQRIDARVAAQLRELELRLVMREEFDRRFSDEKRAQDEKITRLITDRAAEVERRLEEKVNALTGRFDGLFQKLDNWMKSADERIDARTGEVKLLRQNVARTEEVVLALDRRQRSQHERVKRLHATIHGDPEIKDGPPSLFEMLEKVGLELERSNDLTTQEIDQSKLLVAQNSSWIKAFEEERARNRAKWDRRKKLCYDTINWFFKTKPGQALIVAAIVAAFYILRPDLALWIQGLLHP